MCDDDDDDDEVRGVSHKPLCQHPLVGSGAYNCLLKLLSYWDNWAKECSTRKIAKTVETFFAETYLHFTHNPT